MIGRAADKIFTRVFIFLIMSVYFWLFTVVGLVIFGFGPALRTVTEMYMDKQWDYKLYSIKDARRRFRKNFWKVNLHTWLFVGIGAFLAYNLFLSTKLHLAWMLFVQFIIIAAIILDFCLGVFTLLLRSRYDVAFKDAVKLAMVQFFSNFIQLLMFIMVTGIAVVLSLKWPGMILFITPGLYLVVADVLSKQWYAKVDGMLEAAA